MKETAEDIRRAFNKFRARGPRQWNDGSAVQPDEEVLHFIGLLFVVNIEKGAGKGVRGTRDAASVLTGSAMSRAISARVNDSPIGQRYVRAGQDPLGRVEYWDELIIPLPNPSEVAWARASDVGDYAGAMQMDHGVWVVSFGIEYSPLLDELRHSRWARRVPGVSTIGAPPRPDIL